MGRINNKFDLEKYVKLKEKLDKLTLLKHEDNKISLTYIILAPKERIRNFIKGATTTKRHFAQDGAKYLLKLGAFSQDLQKNLTLHNMKN